MNYNWQSGQLSSTEIQILIQLYTVSAGKGVLLRCLLSKFLFIKPIQTSSVLLNSPLVILMISDGTRLILRSLPAMLQVQKQRAD